MIGNRLWLKAYALPKESSEMSRKIVTSFMNPPIPVRSFDWCAHYEGEEEAGNYGWGRSEAEAVEDFKENCAEDHDARLNKFATRQQFSDMHDKTMAMVKAVVGID